jgi:hypothetical protein
VRIDPASLPRGRGRFAYARTQHFHVYPQLRLGHKSGAPTSVTSRGVRERLRRSGAKLRVGRGGPVARSRGAVDHLLHPVVAARLLRAPNVTARLHHGTPSLSRLAARWVVPPFNSPQVCQWANRPPPVTSRPGSFRFIDPRRPRLYGLQAENGWGSARRGHARSFVSDRLATAPLRTT